MAEIASVISEAIENRDGDLSALKTRIETLCDKHPLYN